MTHVLLVGRATRHALAIGVAAVAIATLATGCGRQQASPPVTPPLLVDLPFTSPSTSPTAAPDPLAVSDAVGAEVVHRTWLPATVAPETIAVAALNPPAPTPTPKPSPVTTPTPKGSPSTPVTRKVTPAPSPSPAPTPPAVTTPVSDPSWQACSTQLGGVSVSVGARQRTVTVVNGNGGTTATVSFWLRTNTPCGFANAFTDGGGRVGYGGITNGANRVQGSGTTPTGTYTMTEAFGIRANPGSALLYRRVAAGDFWVEDNNSAFYNQYRNEALGGFDASLPLSDPNGSERLSSFPGQYDYVIVVNFNRAPDAQRANRGAGIFIHVNGSGATAGCVSVTSSEMVTMLRAMRPGDTVTIVP